jgi:hypothetical protein
MDVTAEFTDECTTCLPQRLLLGCSLLLLRCSRVLLRRSGLLRCSFVLLRLSLLLRPSRLLLWFRVLGPNLVSRATMQGRSARRRVALCVVGAWPFAVRAAGVNHIYAPSEV